MRKAFICHSSKDKDYARFVARKLRRANVVFDEMSFEPGQDFRDEILDARVAEVGAAIVDTSIKHHKRVTADASERKRRERKALERLDNIQRGMRPLI